MNLVAATVSLALCVAAFALWGRSYIRHDRVDYASAPGPSESQLHLGAESTQDTIAIGYVYYRPATPHRLPPPFTPGLYRSAWTVIPGAPNGTRRCADENGRQVAGFGIFAWPLSLKYANADHPVYNYGVLFPRWSIAVFTGVAAWIFYRKGRSVPQGLCPACGYDLRATPERCPECGTPATTAAPAAR
jgi:hypothetical protein